MTSEKKEIIQYHIENKFIMTIDRCFDGEITSVEGFPICLSEEFILTTIIVDFRDEGYAILRTRDIVDAYSNKSDSFIEQICISEGLQNEIQQQVIQDLSSIKQILLQLKSYNGFISIQCENQIEKCTFYLGRIITVENDGVYFKDVGMDGIWDDKIHKIPYDEITQISYGDNYSKMFYKYVENGKQ